MAIRVPVDVAGATTNSSTTTTTTTPYVGRMQWASANVLAVTFLNRNQTAATTVLCQAPSFACRTVHIERIADDGLVLANDRILFGGISDSDDEHDNGHKTDLESNHSTDSNHSGATPSQLIEFDAGAYLFKRLPVRDGANGFFRHVTFVSCSDQRTLPLTSGAFEVHELLGWDAAKSALYFLAAPQRKPGERHMYRMRVRFNRTVASRQRRMLVSATEPLCMTCDNAAATFRLRTADKQAANRSSELHVDDDDDNDDDINIGGFIDGLINDDDNAVGAFSLASIPNNCLYNRIVFSPSFEHYVQECLGPDVPSVYLVETRTLHKVAVLNDGAQLRRRVASLAMPQAYTLDVEIRDGFHAQVRLLLPPGLREDEDVAYPLIVEM